MIKIVSLTALLLACASAQDLSTADSQRAHLPKPREISGVLAPNAQAVPETINSFLSNMIPAENLQSCESITDITELNRLLVKLTSMANPRFQEIYASKNDKRTVEFSSQVELQAQLDNELNMIQGINDPKLQGAILNALINAKCVEAGMLYVHHLTATKRSEVLSEGTILPLYPSYEDVEESLETLKGLSLSPDAPLGSAENDIVVEVLAKSVGKVMCFGAHAKSS